MSKSKVSSINKERLALKKNMKRIIIFFALSFLFTHCPFLGATPPSAVHIEYNAGKKILHLEIKHISRNLNDHYIRRVNVTKNDNEIKKFIYPRQSSPPGFSEDIDLDAQSGDIIRVKVFCNRTGPKEEAFVVP